ncbi:hypothetical protein [Chelativorans sp. YIM 93263]|uniref:hypothetical protein n=1 Tax=Chelativorans sp. YIM 93263 TaxID=2906648 RepID=UPI002379AE57|nr:hypothetical protein [Chelativorans sp. YIM 93263]
MSSLSRKSFALFLAAAFAVGGAIPAGASDRERRFFEQIEGQWTGPGEIVAGKYEGTKFVCNLTGSVPDRNAGMALEGGCRVGLFNKKMSARVERAGGGYRGTFLDGANGEGLDVTGGRVGDKHVVFSIHRQELTGAMQARIADENTMNVTISVHVGDELVPVIGVSLKRTDDRTVGAITSK